MIISINVGKVLDKIQHTFMVKCVSKLGIEENFFDLKKGSSEKLTSYLIVKI